MSGFSWCSDKQSFKCHKSHAFGKTNQAPIRCFNVKCVFWHKLLSFGVECNITNNFFDKIIENSRIAHISLLFWAPVVRLFVCKLNNLIKFMGGDHANYECACKCSLTCTHLNNNSEHLWIQSSILQARLLIYLWKLSWMRSIEHTFKLKGSASYFV